MSAPFAMFISSSCLLSLPLAVAAVESSLCPCASAHKLTPINSTEAIPGINVDTYGIGCSKHDELTSACDLSQVDPTCAGVVPTPAHCGEEFAWCSNAWCYVDMANCQLTQETSAYFPTSLRSYSYATCGYSDEYFNGRRSAVAMRGAVLRVGFLRNSGGWQGSYHPVGHYTRDDEWEGPMVDLAHTLETVSATRRRPAGIHSKQPSLLQRPLHCLFAALLVSALLQLADA